MYQTGDLIVYGSMGVCRILNVSVPDFLREGEEKDYYTLEPLNRQGTIFVPVDTSVFMRPVISREEAEDLIDAIPTFRAKAYHSHVLQELNQHYADAISSHEISDLVKLLMSIHVKRKEREKQNLKIGAVDENYMRRAESLLYGELSIALDIPESDVPGYIRNRVDAHALYA